MPMPTPNNDESQDDFINRCMGDDVMVDDFPDEGQRFAVCQAQWQNKESADMKDEKRSAIAIHHTATSGEAWDGPGAKANLRLDADERYYKSAFAWQDPDGDPQTKAAYKFIHHNVSADGTIGAANIKGCQSGIGVLNGAMGGADIPSSDRQGVYNHMAAHLRDADMEPAELSGMKIPAIDKRELRFMPFGDWELREDGDKPPKLIGYASVFNEESEIMGLWRERVTPGAYKKTIRESDIRALWNHNTDLVLGRNKAGTLKLIEDKHGLRVEIDPPDTQAGRDAMTSIRRGDVSQMSIAFQTIKQDWKNPISRDDLPLRIIREAKLYEVSPVTFPAFETTEIQARSGLYLPNGDLDPLEEARRLLRCAERGLELTTEQRQVIVEAVELYQPYLLEPGGESHSNLHEPEPEAEGRQDHSEPEPDNLHDEAFYSELERARRLDEILQTLKVEI